MEYEQQTDEDKHQEPTHNTTASTHGRRVKQLRKALGKTVEKCVTSGKISLFATYLDKMAQSRTESFREIHSQYQQHLRESIKEEIETLFNEEMIAELMNELDALEDEAEHDMPEWRPTGDPQSDITAHIVSRKLKQKEKLGELLEEIQEEGRHLEEATLARRIHLSKSIARVDSQVSQLQQMTQSTSQHHDYIKLLG